MAGGSLAAASHKKKMQKEDGWSGLWPPWLPRGSSPPEKYLELYAEKVKPEDFAPALRLVYDNIHHQSIRHAA